MSRPRSKSRAERGYTLVELMMALALFMVSMLGIISLQRLVVTTNAHAKNLATAQLIARSWAAQLQLDSTLWTNNSLSGRLNEAGAWQRPGYDSTRRFGAAFDALGNPLQDSDAGRAQARYCTHVRMKRLYGSATGVTGSDVLRAEIRVFWLREGESTFGNANSVCGTQTDAQVKDIGGAVDRYHFVYQVVGLRQHFQI
jgi:prepilin-type N-terminal cleavage/methylation domain-containing protein